MMPTREILTPALAALLIGMTSFVPLRAQEAPKRSAAFTSLESLEDYYRRQAAELQRRRIADLAALATRKAGPEADAVYRKLFHLAIAHDLAMEVIRFARERKLHVQAYRDDQLLVERDRAEAHEYAGHAGMQIHVVDDFDQAMGATTPKLVIVAASATLEALLPEVRRRWAGRLNVATSMPTYLEFTSVESDKATALQYVCDRMGVARAETVAVGDGRNDASMIEWAGLGIAVEGSPPEVQAAADRTIPGPGHGGIKQLADLLLRS